MQRMKGRVFRTSVRQWCMRNEPTALHRLPALHDIRLWCARLIARHKAHMRLGCKVVCYSVCPHLSGSVPAYMCVWCSPEQQACDGGLATACGTNKRNSAATRHLERYLHGTQHSTLHSMWHMWADIHDSFQPTRGQISMTHFNPHVGRHP
jgi:hypothetical protein